ncbi:MAG: hypothetical protein ABR523_01610, partial [Desulfurivibrionaceae bacterium]
MDLQNVHALIAITMLVVIALIIFLHIHKNTPVEPLSEMDKDKTAIVKVASGEEMIKLFKKNDLLELGDNGAVAPLLLASYPD